MLAEEENFRSLARINRELIGKAEAIAERQEGELIVHALYEDEPWSVEQRAAVLGELESLARWLDLALVLP